MYKLDSKNNKRGFTLVEIMVSLGIFSLVMLVSMGAILAIVGANKKAQALHNIINNLNLAIETMVRDLRTGYDYNCNSGGDCPSGGESVTFESMQFPDDSGDPQTESYFLSDGSIKKTIAGETFSLTSDEVQIDTLKFYVSSTVVPDNEQPRILLIIRGHTKSNSSISKFNIQTFISQRRLDL